MTMPLKPEYINELIAQQQSSFENIKQICSNFKKDSSSRKTFDYLKKRLEALNSHWNEFQLNHNTLELLEEKNIDYFTQDIYIKTRALYDETKGAMLKMLGEGTDQDKSPASRLLTPSHGQLRREEVPIQGNSGKSDEVANLLRHQKCNMMALARAIAKINLDNIDEKWELEDHLSILKTKWDAVEKLHLELNFILMGSDSKYEDEFNLWEKTYDSMKRDINKKIWASSHYQKSTPKLEIPDFNGQYNQWINFKDIYLETIHNNPLLTKTQKMQHLKSKLKGEAEKLVQHLNISADNYDSCWDIIIHRYDNKRLLFSSYVNTLLNQPIMQQANAFNIKKLHDTTLECMNGLNNIGLETTAWHPFVTHILLQKLDPTTYSEYIHELTDPRELPELDDFIKFLETKFMALDTIRSNQKHGTTSTPYKPISTTQNNKIERPHYYFKSTNFKQYEKSPKSLYTSLRNCPLCKMDHVLMQCKQFLNMNVATRTENVTKLKICKNCLYIHDDQKCMSTKVCKVCNKKHHTLLHNYDFKPDPSSSKSSNHANNEDQEILLTTVQIQVRNHEGSFITLRALLDQGSQVTLITENAAQRLRLPRHKLNAAVTGVGFSGGNSRGLLKLHCKSIHTNYTFDTEALIMSKLINNLPNSTLNTTNWDHLCNVRLADPDFYISGPIDLLLGADIYSEIILEGVLKHGKNTPVAQQTKLGWILCGNTKTYNCFFTLNDLKNISKFWESEEIPNENDSATSEEYCEQHYMETTERLENGRYVVQMPLKNEFKTKLGESKQTAVAQFKQLERKMARKEYFAQQYKQFIMEYTELGHMKPSTRTSITGIQVYLPHHGVTREDSLTTKLRVVFNASMKTSSGYSLNDMMEKGPNLQKDILALITKWRSFKYVLTADIEKMYRQILLHEDQQPLQQIVWRSSPHDLLQEMQLCTVTYGTKAAPYLAMRTLKQLAIDEGDNYPEAKKALLTDCYVDDVITGHHTIEKTINLQKQLYDLLKKGGFILRKWATNDPAILQHLPEQQKSQQITFNFKQEEATKTLGIEWNQTKDVFGFNWELPTPNEQKYTKRKLLSDISKIFDPLGWLAPTTVLAKLLFQKLWTQNLTWDDVLPSEILKEWKHMHSELKSLKKIIIPRWIKNYKQTIELHAFCDASEKAYACVIYSRTTTETGDYVTTLLAAKTKVAPLKNKTSLPRLELCGALLLAKLLEKIKESLKNYILSVYCWTDSQVVLAWLQGNKTKWDKYITTRTTYIKTIVQATDWRYVKSNENPADCATRGLSPKQLESFSLWWHGPQWMSNWNLKIAEKQENYITNEEQIKNCFATEPDKQKSTKDNLIINLLNNSSNVTRTARVIAWVSRYIRLLCNKKRSPLSSELTINEINESMNLIIKTIQNHYFEEEIQGLKKSGKILTKSKLLTLTPYLDEHQILRVGGRLQHSALPEETKHPIILPSEGRLTRLIIERAHRQTLHGGARLTLAQTRQAYWIISGNRTVKKIVRECIRCHRYKHSNNEQLMGSLPEARVTPSRPFTHTGIDFTGHVDIKINKGRGVKTCKGYVAIFICMATKAVHIELVSDLSTETFIAALKRMCARRGTPQHIYSDNGRNFVGAARVLKEEFMEYKTMLTPTFFKEIEQLKLQWHFNAPLWPSAGGLWEAAVKALKHHLKRVLGEQKLTFEQFTTLLCQVEACLNSRPLCPITEDPEDLDYLTPGHFLTGTPIMSLPQKEQTSKTLDVRNRWKLVELMNQHLWNRWSKEYLNQLQERSKWQRPKDNIQKGDLVLIKDNQLPPGKWGLGRVTDLHPGSDGYVRVVTLKTKNGILKRPISQLSPLPMNNSITRTTTLQSEPETISGEKKKKN